MADWYVSSAANAAIPQWQATHAYTIGNIVRPLTAPTFASASVFRCTTAGTSAGTEPVWGGAQGVNNTLADGSPLIWTNVAGLSAYGWGAAALNLFGISWNGNGFRLAVGDRVFLSSDHSESNAGGTTYSFCGTPFGSVSAISVNRAGSVPPVPADALSGANLSSGGTFIIDPNSNQFWQGITFTMSGSSGGLYFASNSAKLNYFRNCTFVFATSNTTALMTMNNPGKVTFDNTAIQFNAAGQRLALASNYGIDFTWINTPTPILGTVPTVLFISTGGGSPAIFVCRGLDLSALTTTLCYGGNYAFAKALFDSCRIAPGVVRLGTATYANAADEIELVNCYNGTAFLSERHTPAGDVTTEFSTTMIGGPRDDVGLFSHKMVSSTRSDSYAMTLDGFWLDVENTNVGALHTATVELISSALLNNNDIRLILEYQGTAGSSLASFADSAPPLTTVAALPASTATWNNAPATIAGNVFDPNFNTAGITLSNGNLTATARISSSDQTIRTNASFNSGKIYYEITCNASGGNNTNVGLVNQQAAANSWLGSTANGISYNRAGLVQTSGGTVVTMVAWTVGDVICVAVDIANQKLWFRKNNGNWNNTVGNDPATNTGGSSITALLTNSGNVFPALATFFGTDQLTLNTGGTTFAQTVPSGFTTMSSALVGGPQRLSVTFTQQTAGRLRALVRLGKPSTTVWYNPQIVLT